MNRTPKHLALACALGLALAGAAAAQSDAPTPAQQQELDAARADLDRAAKHYAELSGKYHAAPMAMTFESEMIRRKPLLGVLLAPDPQSGVRIAGVTPDGAAAAAGLKSGDRLLSVDGNAISGATDDARLIDARTKLSKLDAKTPVRVAYVRDGRAATVSVTPRIADNVFVWNGNGQVLPSSAYAPVNRRIIRIDNDESPVALHGDVLMTPHPDGSVEFDADSVSGTLPPGVAPEIHREVIRLGDGNAMFVPDCKGKSPCARLPILLEAFRWNGLNLASLDAQLGRYFGTDTGVLVLSPGPQLSGLQAGDVIRSIDGKPVATPREAMDALRARKQGDKARLALLRDHRDASVQVTVPKAMPLPIPPIPPVPPAPPVPPGIGAVPALPVPPAAPQAPGAPRMVERRQVVVVDANGKQTEWDDDGSNPPPPAPPAPPAPPPPGGN